MDLNIILENYNINAGMRESLYNLLDISGSNTFSCRNELPKRISFSFQGDEKPYLDIQKIDGGYKAFFSLSWDKREEVGISMKTYSYELTYNLYGELVNHIITFSYHPSMLSPNNIIYFITQEGIYDENWDLVLEKDFQDKRPHEERINDLLARCESASVNKKKHLNI